MGKLQSAGITELEWKRLDNLHREMRSSMLEWCIAVSYLEDRQDDIADRYGLKQSAVAMMSKIGDHADKFIISNDNLIKNLPSGYNSLYMLKDLSQTEIKRLCKHGIPTQQAIRSRKIEKGLIAVKDKSKYKFIRPVMGKRLDGNATNPYYILDISEESSVETVKLVAKHWKHKYHPDKGGDAEAFGRISDAESVILSKRGA